MNHFLVVYNRREGRIVTQEGYPSASEALRARFSAERQYQEEADVEVVVLGGESWDDLRRTHSRYFSGVQQLAKTGLERLATAES